MQNKLTISTQIIFHENFRYIDYAKNIIKNMSDFTKTFDGLGLKLFFWKGLMQGLFEVDQRCRITASKVQKK